MLFQPQFVDNVSISFLIQEQALLPPFTETLSWADKKPTKEERRKLLEGSTIVFFTAGYAGKRFIYERAMQLGVKSVAWL